MSRPLSHRALALFLWAFVLPLSSVSCDGDDEAAGGGGHGDDLDSAQSELLECRVADLHASYGPASGIGSLRVLTYTPPGRFPIPASVPAINPHPNIELAVSYYLLSGATEVCRYRCVASGGACTTSSFELASCSGAVGSYDAGDLVSVTKLRSALAPVGPIPTSHPMIYATPLSLNESGPCPNPCSSVDDNNACTLDRCVDSGGTFQPLHTNVCGSGNLAPGVATSIGDSLEELLAGTNPVQHDASPIDMTRAAGITGRVMKPGGTTPAEGIRIAIAGHPELGWTETDAAGDYVMLVAGGEELVVDIGSQGYLPLHRTVPTLAQQWSVVDTVELTEASSQSTRVVLSGSSLNTVTGETTPSEGPGAAARTPRLLVPGNVGAHLVVGGVAQTATLPAITLRMTEYTVGPNGLAKMPAPLPGATAYTYAIEITSDEAEAAGAEGVSFDAPVYFYVDNFLGFPVGTVVPQGRYDRKLRSWVPEDDGIVIEVLANGAVNLDADAAADADLYATHGITSAERTRLGSLYPAGTKLWRVRMTHFSPIDLNWGPLRPADACDPDACDDIPDDPRNEGEATDATCEAEGSIIECDNQILGERIALPGTGLTLDYRSDRVPGYAASRQVSVPVIESVKRGSLRASVVGLEVAGTRQSYRADCLVAGECDLNERHTFTWDGKDRFSRTVLGRQFATVTWDYEYPTTYGVPTTGGGRSFGGGRGNGGSIAVPYVRVPTGVSRYRRSIAIGSWDARSFGLGGWSLSAVHAYDPISKIVHYGDGRRRSVEEAVPTVRTPQVATFGGSNYLVAVRKNGDLLVASGTSLQRVVPGATTAASVPLPSESGGTAAVLGMTVSEDDRLYIRSWRHVWRYEDVSATWTKLAGNGTDGSSVCDGNADALSAPLPSGGGSPSPIAVSRGVVYLVGAIGGGARICRVNTDGRLRLLAGDGNASNFADGIPAVNASVVGVPAMASGPDGSIYFLNGVSQFNTVRRVAPDGVIETVAGSNSNGDPFATASGPAAGRRVSELNGLAVAADGAVYFSERFGSDWAGGTTEVIRAVRGGLLTTVAGRALPANCPTTAGTQEDFCGSGGRQSGSDARAVKGPAGDVRFYGPRSLAVAPSGSVAVGLAYAVALIEPALPGMSLLGGTDIPSEDGKTVDVFDGRGLHLRTRDRETGIDLATFGYDAQNRITSITDRDGLVTTIARPNGKTATITGPYGHQTVLTIDGDGWATRVKTPGPSTTGQYDLTYLSAGGGGLLGTFKNPRNAYASTFSYDALGRLTRDENAKRKSLGLTRAPLDDGRAITLTSPLGRATTHEIERFADRHTERRVEHPDGTDTFATRTPDTTTLVSYADGSSVTTVEGADPLWGTLAPYLAKQIVDIPGVGTRTVVTKRTATTSGATPFDFGTITDSVWINPTLDATGLPASSSPKYVRTFDKATSVETWTTPAGRSITRALNADARTASAGLAGTPPSPAIAPVFFTYDGDGRLQISSQAGPGGPRQTSRTYQALDGLLDTFTDPAGKVTSFDWDTSARLLSVTRPVVGATSFSYELDSLLSTVTPPGKPSHTFASTPTDLVASYTPPAVSGAGATSYTYNDDDQLDLITLPNGQLIDLVYDAAKGRLLAAQRTTTEKLTFDYDLVTGQLETLKGPTWTTSVAAQQTLTRSFAGPLLTDETSAGAVAGTVGLAYDGQFRVSSEAVTASGTTTSVPYGYDADGLVTSAGPLTIQRDAATGRIVSSCLGQIGACDGVDATEIAEQRTYDEYGALDTLTYLRGGATLFATTYDRDVLGRIWQLTETIAGVTSTYVYTYDDAGRLTDVTKNAVLVEHYVYQPNGNRTSTTNSAGTNVAATFDNQDRVTAVGTSTVTHNANGEVTSRTAGSLPALAATRNVFGDLLTASGGGSATQTYVVDAEGRRRKKTSGSTFKASWLWRGNLAPVAELSATNVLTKRFIYAENANVPDVVTTPSGGPVYRLIKDHLGSVRLVVRQSDGAILRRLDFDAYGRKLATSSGTMDIVPFGFAGGLWDPDTGLVRFGARDYDPETGRWLTKDPSRFGGGTNLYEYAAGDPVNYVDLDGHNPLLVAFTVLAFLEVFLADNEQAAYDAAAGNMLGLGMAHGLGQMWRAGAPAAAAALICEGNAAESSLCFAAGTLVDTEKGLIPIEDVRIGDQVWTRDEETGSEGWMPVTQLFVTPDRATIAVSLEGDDGSTEELRVTREHPFWSIDDGAWEEAGDLAPGEVVESLSGSMRVASSLALPGVETVYNFEVEGSHTYFVGEAGVWVHNQCSGRFATEAAFKSHYAKHAGEWGGSLSPAEYLARAKDLLGRAPGGDILGHVRTNGDVLRYNVATNEFAAMANDGTIRTLFRPTDGLAYWQAQVAP